MYYKITNASVSINSNTILEEINFEIKDKDHIAIIGRNGAGKTTLLEALINNDLLSPGIGEEKFSIFKSNLNNFDIGYLNQNNKLDENKTLLDEILTVYEPLINLEKKLNNLEIELDNGASIEKILKYQEYLDEYKLNNGYLYKKEYMEALKKFGFRGYEFSKLISAFSGGEKTKIAFLKLLLSKPKLLLLDEPTNHLDLDAIEWLEEYLLKYPSAFIIVSHDRMFINNTSNKIIEIEYGKTEEYYGNYEYYIKEKKARYEKSLKDYEYQQKEIARLERIVERFRYKPAKASMAMSKLKQIKRMKKLSKPEQENLKTFNINFANFKPSGNLVLKVDNLSIGYDFTLNTCSFELLKHQRLGVIGENGIGKSTLLKTLMHKINPISGEFYFGHNVQVGYFDQELNNLDSNLTVYQEYEQKFPNLNDFNIRRNLATFLFYEEDLEKLISNLSGGEMVRLALCEILTNNPNLLILDEPTNHLDILSKNHLEDILKNYPGTIIFVSHDRMFVNNIADSILEFKKDNITYYNLTYKEYIEKNNQLNNNQLSNNVSSKKEVTSKVKKTNNQKELQKLEKEISKLEDMIKTLKNSLYDSEIYSNLDKIASVNNEIRKLETKLNSLMEEWTNLYQTLCQKYKKSS